MAKYLLLYQTIQATMLSIDAAKQFLLDNPEVANELELKIKDLIKAQTVVIVDEIDEVEADELA